MRMRRGELEVLAGRKQLAGQVSACILTALPVELQCRPPGAAGSGTVGQVQ